MRRWCGGALRVSFRGLMRTKDGRWKEEEVTGPQILSGLYDGVMLGTNDVCRPLDPPILPTLLITYSFIIE